MYEITQYSKDQAKKLGVMIKPSTRKNKKIDVFDKNLEYITSIGDNRYKDFPTYKKEKGEEYANKRREAYKKRHEKDRHIKGTAGFFADKILW
jgi:hypothetical protein